MYDTNVIILADLNEFPHAQNYAACFSVLFSDIGRRSVKGKFAPERQDYSKVYIASKNTALIKKFKYSHSKFDVTVVNDIPDYSEQEVRKVASMLIANSYVNPFDDLKSMRRKEAQRAALEAQAKAAEARGEFTDPRPDIKLDPSIKLMRKGNKDA